MDVAKLIEDIKSMSVLELFETVKALEEEFGVSAAAAAAVGAAPAGDAPAAVVKTEFDVVLTSVGAEKLKVVKAVKDLIGLGLKEAKALVDGAEKEPSKIKEAIPQEEAEKIVAALKEVGATCEIK